MMRQSNALLSTNLFWNSNLVYASTLIQFTVKDGAKSVYYYVLNFHFIIEGLQFRFSLNPPPSTQDMTFLGLFHLTTHSTLNEIVPKHKISFESQPADGCLAINAVTLRVPAVFYCLVSWIGSVVVVSSLRWRQPWNTRELNCSATELKNPVLNPFFISLRQQVSKKEFSGEYSSGSLHSC